MAFTMDPEIAAALAPMLAASGRPAMRVALAAYESARTGSPVSITTM